MSAGKKQRTKRLESIKKKARELADMLVDEDGPVWPSAIELFDEAHRPFAGKCGKGPAPDWPLDEYRRAVSGRLAGQSLPQLLKRLAVRAETQERMDARDPIGRDAPRPSGKKKGKNVFVFERLLARQIRDWFGLRCATVSGESLFGLITDLINARRDGGMRTAVAAVTVEQVKEWLRRQRNRGASDAP